MTSASKTTSRRKASTTSTSPSKTAKTPAKRPAGTGTTKKPARAQITPEQRRRMIAEAAYLRAESRGFAPGDPVHDWLRAEQEVDAHLAGQAKGTDAAAH